MARDFWHEVQAVSGHCVGYARLGRVQPIADDAALKLAQARAMTAQDFWGTAAEWQVDLHLHLLVRDKPDGNGNL